VLQDAEVEHHDHADEHFEQQDELALRDQVRLARLVNELGYLEHRPVHRHVAQPGEDDHAERQAEDADDEPRQQERPAVDALKGFRGQIGKNEIGLASTMGLGLSDRRVRRRLGMGGRGKGERQHQRGDQKQNAELSGHYLAGGLRPAGPPDTLARGDPDPTPLAWLTRCCSFASHAHIWIRVSSQNTELYLSVPDR
jgi:hypothetical protein